MYRGRNAWKEARMAVKRSGRPSPTEEEILMLELSELMAGALSLVKVHNRSRARARIQKIAEERVERAALCVANISSGQGKSRSSCANKSNNISAKKPGERKLQRKSTMSNMRKGGLTWHCCNLYGESIRAVRAVATVIGLESTGDVPEEVEAKNGDPRECGNVDEVANVSDHRARVFGHKITETVGCGAVQVETVRTREMGKE